MDSSSTRKLGSLDPNHTAVMVCDLQEKFAPSILHFDTIVQNADRLVQAANILQMPVLATEQYPKGLGMTVKPLSDNLVQAGTQTVAKTKFTMVVPEIELRLDGLFKNKNIDTIVLCGIETHVCIWATCIDLIHRGFNVHIVADAVSSRTQIDRRLALERMKGIGGFVNSTESVILSLVGDASHPQFKNIQAIIKQLSPDTGLLHG